MTALADTSDYCAKNEIARPKPAAMLRAVSSKVDLDGSVASGLSAPDADVIGITEAVSFAAAEDFLRLFYSETGPPTAYVKRLREVRTEIDENGTYRHTSDELRFGARVAWRNSARCIGRLYWKSLSIRDRRTVSDPSDVAAECVSHLYESTRRRSHSVNYHNLCT